MPTMFARAPSATAPAERSPWSLKNIVRYSYNLRSGSVFSIRTISTTQSFFRNTASGKWQVSYYAPKGYVLFVCRWVRTLNVFHLYQTCRNPRATGFVIEYVPPVMVSCLLCTQHWISEISEICVVDVTRHRIKSLSLSLSLSLSPSLGPETRRVHCNRHDTHEAEPIGNHNTFA